MRYRGIVVNKTNGETETVYGSSIDEVKEKAGFTTAFVRGHSCLLSMFRKVSHGEHFRDSVVDDNGYAFFDQYGMN